MYRADHENQSDPELVIDLTHRPDGWTVEVRRAGTVRYSDRGFKTRDAAWEAGRVFVRAWLRAQLGAAGVTRRAERPVYVPPTVTPVANLHDVVGGPAAELPEPVWPSEQLEGEQLCTCGHSDGEHILGANGCSHALSGPGRPFCPCGEFTPVALVEAVDDAEVRS